MDLVIFSHPHFMRSQSMPRFAAMLAEGMRQRGHKVQIWSPQAFFYHLPASAGIKKWLGYVDQFFLFPLKINSRIKRSSVNTLFVFSDQALGPWVPMVVKRPHVIHCHDFLAQQSALGYIPENKTGATGKIYQSLIFKGYSRGKHFISVSKKTQEDLHQLLSSSPLTSEVVYNGLNQSFKNLDAKEARKELSSYFKIDLSMGFLLHVGGNQWYKNRYGVIKIYETWRQLNNFSIPLLLIGESPDTKLLDAYSNSPFNSDIHILTGIEDKWVRIAYAGALVFLFPSYAEGFGWPIAEAMASGCPVITTKERPMTEVGNDVCFYIDRAPVSKTEYEKWLKESAKIVDGVINLTDEEREKVIKNGIQNSARFDGSVAIDQIEEIYKKVVAYQ